MSTRIFRLAAITLSLVVAVGLAPSVVSWAAPAAQGNRGESPCSPRLRSRAEPFTLLWGETTRVSLFLGPKCGVLDGGTISQRDEVGFARCHPQT